MAEVTEAEFQSMVIVLLRTYGWKYAHFGNTVKYVRRKDGYKVIPDKNATGYPDITAVRGGRVIFAELKREKGKVTRAQQDWLDALAMTGMEVYIWRPSDLDAIQGLLNRA